MQQLMNTFVFFWGKGEGEGIKFTFEWSLTLSYNFISRSVVLEALLTVKFIVECDGHAPSFVAHRQPMSHELVEILLVKNDLTIVG